MLSHALQHGGRFYLLLMPIGLAVTLWGLRIGFAHLRASVQTPAIKGLMVSLALLFGGGLAYLLAQIRLPLGPNEWAYGLPFPIGLFRMLPHYGHGEAYLDGTIPVYMLLNLAFGTAIVSLLLAMAQAMKPSRTV